MQAKVAVIGLGYIGLPTATIIASKGISVIGVDVKESTIEAVNSGKVPFVEPDLESHLVKAVEGGFLSASLQTPSADIFIIAVPTPFKKEGNAPDLSYIDAAVDKIAPQLKGGELIILESTSPPGATKKMAQRVLSARPDLDADSLMFAHCPERVLPGRVMIELVSNDRIVGGITTAAAERAKELYEVFCDGEIILTDATTAEMAKLVENSFRDVNIAFANELSLIADKVGVDVWELIKLANHHPRVNILQPGPGVGGHCIAVDPWFIVDAAPEEAKIIRMAREVNDAKPFQVVEKVKAALKDSGSKTLAVMGLAFKANIDDLRESPACFIAELLASNPDLDLLVVEPHIEKLPSSLSNLSNVKLVSLTQAAKETNIGVLLVDHDVFVDANISSQFSTVIDTRGITS